MFETRRPRAVSQVAIFLVTTIFLGGWSASSLRKVAAAQQAESQPSSWDSKDQAAIAAIIQTTLRDGAGVTSEGVNFQTCVPPSSESLSTVRRVGERAVPILVKYLWSPNGCESQVAMRLLGTLGGKAIVAPLSEVAQKHPISGRRILALRWLSGQPWELVSPVLRESAEHDPDPGVRDVAREIISLRS